MKVQTAIRMLIVLTILSLVVGSGSYLLGILGSTPDNGVSDNGAVISAVLTAIQVVAGLGAFVLLVVLGVGLRTQFRTLQDSLQSIAEGRTEEKVVLKGFAELNTIAGLINGAIQQVSDMIDRVKDTAVLVNESREDVEATSHETTASLKEISGNIAMMTEQISALNGNIESSMQEIRSINDSIGALEGRLEKEIHEIKQSTSGLQEMSFSINSVAKLSSDKRQAVERVGEVLQEGGVKISQTNAFVSEISNAVDEMLGIITIINTIASQTNLLSMNAAIEAAHAGQYGMGFAVVAEEIRSLSDSTNENAKRIKDVLKRVTEGAKEAQEKSDQSKEYFVTVNEEVGDFTAALAEIVSTMQELSAGSRELITSAEGITTFLQQLKEETDTIASNSETLERTIQNIADASSQVLTGMKDIEQGARDVENGMAQLQEINRKNSDNAERLKILINPS